MKKYAYVYAIWGLLFIVFPLVLILLYSLNANKEIIDFSLTLNNYSKFFEPLYIKILLVSLALASASTLICLLIGYPVAYITVSYTHLTLPTNREV